MPKRHVKELVHPNSKNIPPGFETSASNPTQCISLSVDDGVQKKILDMRISPNLVTQDQITSLSADEAETNFVIDNRFQRGDQIVPLLLSPSNYPHCLEPIPSFFSEKELLTRKDFFS